MFSPNDTLIVAVMLVDPDLPEHLDNVHRKNVFIYTKAYAYIEQVSMNARPNVQGVVKRLTRRILE